MSGFKKALHAIKEVPLLASCKLHVHAVSQ